jgi:hypothetical protein
MPAPLSHAELRSGKMISEHLRSNPPIPFRQPYVSHPAFAPAQRRWRDASAEKMKIERNYFLRVAFVGWG